MLEWQRAQLCANTCRPRSTAPEPNCWSRSRTRSAYSYFAPRSDGARLVQVGRVGFLRRQEGEDVAEAVLDGAEVRAVAPALADVERRLAEVARLRIDLAQVGEVVHPARLAARTDVEVDALDRLERADGVLAALEDVVHGLGLLRALPALAFACPARTSTACAPAAQSATLRHLLTSSSENVGRCLVWMIALMVPGLLTWSVGIAEVSDVPGRACANICASSVVPAMPEASTSEMRLYWLPMPPLMFSHLGFAGSFGGCAGSNAMWHDAARQCR